MADINNTNQYENMNMNRVGGNAHIQMKNMKKKYEEKLFKSLINDIYTIYTHYTQLKRYIKSLANPWHKLNKSQITHLCHFLSSIHINYCALCFGQFCIDDSREKLYKSNKFYRINGAQEKKRKRNHSVCCISNKRLHKR